MTLLCFPYWATRRFPLGLGRSEFQTLPQMGWASNFLEGDHWPSISPLMSASGRFQLYFWNTLQLHHFLHSIAKPTLFNCSLTTFEDYCQDKGILTQVLSKTYTLLNSPFEQPQLFFLQKWEVDDPLRYSNNKISLDFPSICTKIQESNYKILTRWHYTPQLLQKYIFWSCPKLKHFWTTAQKYQPKIHRL